ncbi:P-loop containing nucleoside triphosphate hydrolase protein [Thermothelomyces heterothallicus CBS 202.75]|uniref:P-loop containing nucleoside triphosphate hydrolase protein n=1 Tax=Thermothelomyces heterothallicus CBS 202.75 TaxID=1149848 RepID=UPI00374310E5
MGNAAAESEREREYLIPDGRPPGEKKEVLVFEFLDGELKAAGKGGAGAGGGGRVRDREDRIKMPVFGQAQMKRLIERRNAKFVQAANEFVEACLAEGLDPEMVLKDVRERFIPRMADAAEQVRERLPSTLPPSIPRERKSIAEIVQELKDSPWYTGQIVPDGHRVFEAQEAVYGELNFLLSQDLVNALYNAKGITQFYAHQAEAINALHDGHNVVVATPTSSGKSLIYQLPVLHALERDLDTRAMYIFPTKALAQDQRRSLREMMSFMPGLEEVLVETFDGDTPVSERNTIRDEARIIFTNPDMLHITILPNEEKWRTFLKNLKYVVVDELHYYNGLMGSHVAFVMRRLRRTCAALGNRRVKFISCSATVANPEQHFKTIFGIDDVRLIDFDGSPSGRKEFICWNTPYKDPGDPASGRGNAMLECSRLFCQLILRGVRVIAFCRVREQCEKLVGAVKQELAALGRGEVVARVMGYRGGYTAQDRRQIESEMFEGKLLGIVATTALELGVDIGTLDCVITWGFPYTIANLRQQSGRAGRRNKDSLSILVGDGFATDQYYMQNPDELFTKPHCELQVDLDNMLVKEGHVQCAAYEMPIKPAEDAVYFGSDLPRLCAERLIQDEAGFYHCHPRFRPLPSRFVSIRDAEEDHFAIVDITNNRNVVLEELEASRATFTIYDGAIFLHQGDTYLVRDVNPDKQLARVERVKVDWLTSQRDYTDVDPVETEAVKRIANSRWRAYYGTIRIKQVVFGYFKVDARRNRILDAVQVDNPPVIRHSKGMWLDVPKRALDILAARRLNVAGAIHAAQHAVMSLVPTFVISMPGDVGTECKSGLKEFARRETQRKRPARLTFYDAKGGAGGSGINTKAFEFVDLLLRQALGRVTACACAAGCVECCASEMCREMNEVMSKAGCEVVLKALLDEEIDVEALPMGPEEGSPAGIETVVLAPAVPTRHGQGLEPDDGVDAGQKKSPRAS